MFRNIRLMVVMLLVAFLPLMAIKVLAAPFVNPTPALDGTNKKKRHRLVRKTGAVSRKTDTNTPPLVEIYGSVEGHQVIVNIYNQPLFGQNMQQDGDKVTLLGTQKTVPTAAEDLKDRQIAEALVKELRTQQAFFLRTLATGNSAGKNTIALNKDSWTDSEIVALQRIISEKFAPGTVSFLPPAVMKRELVIPGSMAAQPTKKDQ